MNKEKNDGSVAMQEFDESKLYEYVYKEVLSYDQVSRFVSNSITENITSGILGKEPTPSGIRIVIEGNEIVINLQIIVYYGINIPQLSYDLQRGVKKKIEIATGLTVTAVNIAVEGIDRR